MPPASPESLCLQCEDRAWSLLQADTRERLEVVSQEEVAARLLRWLDAELRRTNRSGCTSSSCTGRPCSCSSPGCRWRRGRGWGGVFATGRRWRARSLEPLAGRVRACHNLVVKMMGMKCSSLHSSCREGAAWRCGVAGRLARRAGELGLLSSHCYSLTGSSLKAVTAFCEELRSYSSLSSYICLQLDKEEELELYGAFSPSPGLKGSLGAGASTAPPPTAPCWPCTGCPWPV